MAEKNLIIHWAYVPPEEVEGYPILWQPKILLINTIILQAVNLLELDGSTKLPYRHNFDTAIVRRTALSYVDSLVEPGDQVVIYGARTTVCCAMAKDDIARKIGARNVWIHPDGSWD